MLRVERGLKDTSVADALPRNLGRLFQSIKNAFAGIQNAEKLGHIRVDKGAAILGDRRRNPTGRERRSGIVSTLGEGRRRTVKLRPGVPVNDLSRPFRAGVFLGETVKRGLVVDSNQGL